MDAEAALIAALREHPTEPRLVWTLGDRKSKLSRGDAHLRRVWADLLLDRGDPRGEQLMLEDRVEVAPGPTWRRDAEVLLQLVAERGFVCVPEDPDAALLKWEGHVRPDWQFSTVHQGQRWDVVCDDGDRALLVDCDSLEQLRLPLGDRCRTLADTNVLLHLVSDAIRTDRVRALKVPPAVDRMHHARYRTGPYPRYEAPPELAPGCTLAARDLVRWYAIYHSWK